MKSKLPLIWRSFGAVGICLALLACGDKKPPESAPASAPAPAAATPAQAPTPAPAPVEAESSAAAKLQAYIACFNRLDGSAHRTISRYASWVKDMKTGPKGTEKVIYGLYPIHNENVSECAASMNQAVNQKPALPKLDAAAKTYIAALEIMGKNVAETYTYYDREDYKDDKFAKGKTLHAPLAKSFDDFSQASAVFSTELEIENDVLLAAELANIEKTQGRKLAYFHMATMNRAKKVVNLIEKETFDATEATTLQTEFEKIVDEAIAYKKANAAEADAGWSHIASDIENFRKASKERIRRIRDKVPYNEGELMMLKPGSAWMVEGSQEKVVEAYNKLITASNQSN